MRGSTVIAGGGSGWGREAIPVIGSGPPELLILLLILLLLLTVTLRKRLARAGRAWALRHVQVELRRGSLRR